MITLNNNKYNQNTYRGKKTIILICYIQTMKRLPCLICSVNITFIKTKRGMSLIDGTSTALFALKVFHFQPGLLL